MIDDYLWDRSGRPDPDVERLEKTLSVLREDVPAPAFVPVREARRRVWTWTAVAAAAAVVLAVAVWNVVRPPADGWAVASLAGEPRVGSGALGERGSLGLGQWLETDAASRARITVGLIGEVEVGPNSRVGLVASRPLEYRLELERGEIHARIWAPPRLFFVNTPSAVAIDLGCVYTLEVEDSGAGELRVDSGWVQLDSGERQSVVPAGAAAVMRPEVGPGSPFYVDASEAFRQALERVDFGAGDARDAALGELLAEARPRDALTLLALVGRLGSAERGRIYDRLSLLVPPPTGVTRAGIVAGDARMLDQWWSRIGVVHPEKSLRNRQKPNQPPAR
jgi:ferric-dicitrate binding protein FerR (iron transport regulator)